MTLTLEWVDRLDAAPELVRQAVRRLVWEADREFVPPLSARTPEANLSVGAGVDCDPEPEVYWDDVQSHALLTAKDAVGGAVLGLMTVDLGRPMPPLGLVATAYLSTVIVAPQARGRGVARRLYERLFDQTRAIDAAGQVVTRTWSTNASHRPLLDRLGFEVALRIPDDRGPGIDTLYFVKPL